MEAALGLAERAGRAPPPLRLVRLGGEPEGPLPFGAVLRRGSSVGGAPVLFCDPPEGVLAPTTRVEPVPSVSVKVEREGQVVVVAVRPGLATGSEEDVLVYPAKVWDEVESKYIEPIASGRPPVNPGVLFVGPPGTGKSTLIEILARGYGLVPRYIDATVVSSYTGETERRVAAELDAAERAQPSIIVMDECEWLLEARRHSALSGHAAALSGAVSILLRRMQEWKNRGVVALIAAATNEPPSNLDPAFRRPGRFGNPILVPLPDAEAVAAYLKRRGVPPAKAEELARMAVNAGASMAAVAEMVEMMRKGREPRLEPKREKGYRRLAPPPVSRALGARKSLEEIFGRAVPPELLRSPGARTEVVGDLAEAAALPLLAYYAYELGKPVIEVWGTEAPPQVEEAVGTAELGNATIFVRSDYLSDAVISQIHLISSAPVVLFGRRRRLPAAVDVTAEAVVRVGDRFGDLLRLLCAYYDVRFEEAQVARALALPDQRRAVLLSLLPHFSGSALEKALEYAQRRAY